MSNLGQDAPSKKRPRSDGDNKKQSKESKNGSTLQARDITSYFKNAAQKAAPKASASSPNKKPRVDENADSQGNGDSQPSQQFVIRKATVSADSVEHLSNPGNTARRRAFLERRQQLKGRLADGKVDDLLLKLPECGSCKARTGAWISSAYSTQARGKALYKETQKQWYFGANISHFNLRIAVPEHVSKLMESSNKAPYLIQIISKRKYKNEVLRQLRWISTLAYAWLLIQKVEAVEVQTAYDGTTYWITENTMAGAKKLKEFNCAKAKDQVTRAALRKALLETKEETRKKNQEKKPAKTTKTQQVKLDAGDTRLLDRLDRHKRGLDRSGFYDGNHRMRVIGLDKKQHAETKLIDYFLGASQKKGATPATITVAGIRRPCFVCFARLQVAKERLVARGWDLVHKRRPGPYWPTKSALANISTEERKRLMENLMSGWHMYVNGPVAYDRNQRITRKKDETWDDLDTDSDDGGRSDSEDDDQQGKQSGQGGDHSDRGRPAEPTEAERRFDQFQQALLGLPRQAQGSSANFAITLDEDDGVDAFGDSDENSPIDGSGLSFDAVEADIYAGDPEHDTSYWEIAVNGNKADGDCLFHALEDKDLTEAESLALRQNVAAQPNHCWISDAINANEVKQALLQSGRRNVYPAGLYDVPENVYAMLQAVPRIYAGDDEINKWCALRNQVVMVAGSDGSLWEFQALSRTALSPDHKTLKQKLHARISENGIVLWKTSRHFERVTSIRPTLPDVETKLRSSDLESSDAGDEAYSGQESYDMDQSNGSDW